MPHSARAPLTLLQKWIERGADPARAAWYRDTFRAVSEDASEQTLVRAIGLAPRKLGKSDLPLRSEDLAEADRIRPGFDPTGLSIDQAARITFVLDSPHPVAETLERLFATSDLGESIAFFRGFSVFPEPDRLLIRAREGIRSAIKPVFEALAHRNPYPREQFDESSWNQMVLKALFIDSTLAPIQGLDDRANPDLAQMLVDYAQERWSAGRAVSPELWRCVGPFADDRTCRILERLAATGSPPEQDAARHALHQAPPLSVRPTTS